MGLKPTTQGLLRMAKKRRDQHPRAYKKERKHVADAIRGQRKAHGPARYRRFQADVGMIK